ncbi:LPS export ABC transporter permease LptF [Polycladidibacter stylochi]|uniref:LPS export ABC transporter permease LptF n=1 Tax=Polycladidibacter stylochi TaxID=1807766 RepID=UPI000829D44A|nr:LPS export ABC transporter permease LptF [Pseudovibrio stylochi]
MKTIERYIIKKALGSFLITLLSMTGVVWATQALRQLDLVTAKGQTLLQYLYITSLALPFLVVIVAPFAMIIAMVIVLNGMSRDSELIVLNAAGASRSIILKPIMLFAILISGFIAYLTLSLSPTGMALLRGEITRVRVDLVANIIKPGRFIGIEKGLVFHIRNRSGDGLLESLLLNDRREDKEWFTYTAKQGRIVEISGRTLLVMFDGTIQRRSVEDNNLSIVSFENYGFDLSSMVAEEQTPVLKASERPTFDLIRTDYKDAYSLRKRSRFISEFHDRFSQPLYPIVFGMIAFIFMGGARTTRQGSGAAIFGAMATSILLRTAGFGATMLVTAIPSAYPVLYAVPLTAFLFCLWSILSGREVRWLRKLGDYADYFMRKITSRNKNTAHGG